ncbi:type-1 protein geranylgeranyltransferase subunit beta [Magnaporthiopsis poae ATCC 64411]|uniref:Type-1 protein geranylgeranyltransferase subunit beta n=1 Tax=Magnaporthiopsis poae (strain ATCC 64411 / 73-15) TaxID=644358 RepID=A0A0C4EF14_MAGP6|nr:type-1 protein geranylgeranyltransferase subunit beta [Magnaporthiopsis poae ATCC 64411]
MHESHAGYAYCAVGALSLLKRPAEGPWSGESHCGMDVASLVRFLASRQLPYQDPAGGDGDGDGDEDNFPQPSALSRDAVAGLCPQHVGLNGRCNKVADTCYTWWVAGTLDCLRRDQGGGGGGPDVKIAREPARRFLLEKTQHVIGGFSKNPGGPPDVYHAYLGLAALAAMEEPGLKEFDVTLCVSLQTVANIEAGRRGLLKRYSAGDNNMASDKVVRLGELMAGCEAEKLVGNGAGLETAEDGQLLELLLAGRMLLTRT